ncbi:cytochrome ubiquinol oxidase subunit I, partial [Acinetobacter baumannii]
MLGIAWLGSLLSFGERLLRARLFLWATFLSFPLGFIATLTGWFTAEVGRQPWVVYNQLRTADAVTPFLTNPQVATSLAIFATI